VGLAMTGFTPVDASLSDHQIAERHVVRLDDERDVCVQNRLGRLRDLDPMGSQPASSWWRRTSRSIAGAKGASPASGSKWRCDPLRARAKCVPKRRSLAPQKGASSRHGLRSRVGCIGATRVAISDEDGLVGVVRHAVGVGS
jgi:hypothetical protein